MTIPHKTFIKYPNNKSYITKTIMDGGDSLELKAIQKELKLFRARQLHKDRLENKLLKHDTKERNYGIPLGKCLP